MIKQSFCLPLYRPQNMSLRDLLTAAKGIGYAAVEIWQRNENGVAFGELCETASAVGLPIASMCGHYALADGMNKRSNHARICDELRISIELAAKHHIRGLICFSGNVNGGQSDDDARAACAECLRQIAPHAEKHGVLLNMELLNSKIDHPGYQCDHTAWGVDVCRQVNSPAVKLLYDIYHMQIMEGDIIRNIRDHVQWIGHMHTAGNPGRGDFADPDLPQELNYRGICRAIAAAGYTGYLGHEFKPRGDMVAALRSAWQVCDG